MGPRETSESPLTEPAECELPAFLRRAAPPRPEPRAQPCRCSIVRPEPPWAEEVLHELRRCRLLGDSFRFAKRSVSRDRERYLERFYVLPAAGPDRRFHLAVGIEFPALERLDRRWCHLHVTPWVRPASKLLPGVPDPWSWDPGEEPQRIQELAFTLLYLSDALAERSEALREAYLRQHYG